MLSFQKSISERGPWTVHYDTFHCSNPPLPLRFSESVCRAADKADDAYQVTSDLGNEKPIRSINFSHVIGEYGMQ